MLATYLRSAVLATTLSKFVTAQDSKIIPSELQTGFASSGIELQVSYTEEAVNGFSDGTIFEKDAVAKLPEFALGDSSGISSARRLTLLLVDTTCDNARTLHYARTNFKYNFQIVEIESDTAPVLAYQAPGAFGETGDDRKYSWLMYSQPKNAEISELKIPGDGEVFDVQKFQDENGFKHPAGGVGMVVNLGGQTNCDESPSKGGAQSSSIAIPPSSSSVAEPTTSAQRTSAVSSTTTSEQAALGSTVVETSRTQQSTSPSEPVSEPTSVFEGVSSAINSEALVSSTLITSAQEPNATGTSTSASGPAQQTTSDASELSLGMTGYAVLAATLIFSGLMV